MTMLSETLTTEELAHLRNVAGTSDGYQVVSAADVQDAVEDVANHLDDNESLDLLRAYVRSRGGSDQDQANAARSIYYGARSSVSFLQKLIDQQSREMATLPQNHPSEVVNQRLLRTEDRITGYWTSQSLRKEEMAMAEVVFHELTGDHINRAPEKRDRATIAADAMKRAQALREAAGLAPLDETKPQAQAPANGKPGLLRRLFT